MKSIILLFVLALFANLSIVSAQVDLSDVDTDQPIDSPSLDNDTPAGQAPGKPIEDEDEGSEEGEEIPEPSYDDLEETVVV